MTNFGGMQYCYKFSQDYIGSLQSCKNLSQYCIPPKFVLWQILGVCSIVTNFENMQYRNKLRLTEFNKLGILEIPMGCPTTWCNHFSKILSISCFLKWFIIRNFEGYIFPNAIIRNEDFRWWKKSYYAASVRFPTNHQTKGENYIQKKTLNWRIFAEFNFKLCLRLGAGDGDMWQG